MLKFVSGVLQYPLQWNFQVIKSSFCITFKIYIHTQGSLVGMMQVVKTLSWQHLLPQVCTYCELSICKTFDIHGIHVGLETLPTFHIIGDNVDVRQKASHGTMTSRGKDHPSLVPNVCCTGSCDRQASIFQMTNRVQISQHFR